jgi:small subunit ribosomal protein S17
MAESTEVAESAPDAAEAVESVAGAAASTEVSSEAVVVEPTVSARASRKFREGVVVSNGMEKTIVVAITERVRHRRYQRTVQRTKKLYVDDQEGAAKVGDSVRVVETRPLSKLKRWRLVEVLERAR